MEDWNVVVTVRERGFQQAWDLLRPFGAVRQTDYYNVLTICVPDPVDFPEALQRALEQQPALQSVVARAAPVVRTFEFQDAEEFERKAREAVAVWVEKLGANSFHVRMHRRGFRFRISSQREEQLLGDWLVEQLHTDGKSARINFEDPDYILAVETVGQRAGASLWDRGQRQRYAFLGLD